MHIILRGNQAHTCSLFYISKSRTSEFSSAPSLILVFLIHVNRFSKWPTGALFARCNSESLKLSICSLKQLLVSKAVHGEQIWDATADNLPNIYHKQVFLFPRLTKGWSEQAKRVASLRGAHRCPLTQQPCLPFYAIAGCHLHFPLQHLQQKEPLCWRRAMNHLSAISFF